MYKIKEPYTSTMFILVPTTEMIKGVPQKSYTSCINSDKIKCLFKTYGGTEITSNEKDVNGIISVVDTAIVETWYNSKITSDCRLAFDDDTKYEIIGNPENISNRNRTMKIKIRRVIGGA